MRLDAQSPFVWRQINEKIKQQLGCDSRVFLYRGLHQAVFETCLGLHLRFGHKRKIVAEAGFGDHLSQTEIELAKLGVRFKDRFDEDIAKEEKGCLAYIHDLDDALTAELYDHIETLKSIAATKIYRIHLAHHLFHIRKSFVQSLSEFDIIIVALSSDYSLVFTGEKVVLPRLTVGQLPWNFETDWPPVLQALETQEKLFQSEITKFETDLPTGVQPWFTEQPARRIHDRAVVILKDHDGAALLDLLNQALGIETCPLGHSNPIEAASLCRWNNDSWFQQAEKVGRSRQDMQGLMMIDGSIINAEFTETFKACFEKLKELSQ